MTVVERVIPGFVFDWSIQFKTGVIALGASLLLLAAILRPDVSILIWGPIFMAGGLIEWVIVATVYLEMEQLENEIEDTYNEVKEIERDIIETRDKVETARNRLQGLANETYDIQGSGDQFNELEPGGFSDPIDVDLPPHQEGPEERLRQLERRVDDLERKLR